MDFLFPSRNNKNFLVTSDKLTNHDNINLSQEEEPPLFLQFPSPFLDGMSMDTTSTAILPNHHNQPTIGGTTTAGTTTFSQLNKHLKLITATAKPLSSKLKCVRKKRVAGKKDRHSKIHTAQGLRDRRMRLSVHTARKFFDLNDMLGFDKASKTIEWLFNKSKKAIEEVTESLQSDDHPTQTESTVGIAEKDENFDEISRKMIKNMEKPKKLFEADPINVDLDQSQLGFMENPNDQTIQESSCYPLEYSNTYHFLKQLHLGSTVRNPETYLGNMTASISSTISEPSAGWLISRNTFLGFLGGWDSGNSSVESSNGIVANVEGLTGNINGENPSSGMISTSNFVNFHPQNEGQ